MPRGAKGDSGVFAVLLWDYVARSTSRPEKRFLSENVPFRGPNAARYSLVVRRSPHFMAHRCAEGTTRARGWFQDDVSRFYRSYGKKTEGPCPRPFARDARLPSGLLPEGPRPASPPFGGARALKARRQSAETRGLPDNPDTSGGCPLAYAEGGRPAGRAGGEVRAPGEHARRTRRSYTNRGPRPSRGPEAAAPAGNAPSPARSSRAGSARRDGALF